MDEQAREQTFLGAVTTEHIASQAARSAIIAEQVGRAMLYMGAVSSALITFGFVAVGGRSHAVHRSSPTSPVPLG